MDYAKFIRHSIVDSFILISVVISTAGQRSTSIAPGNPTSKVRVADNGDGTYKNPITAASQLSLRSFFAAIRFFLF
jgi:hypothetical protein